MSGLRQAQDERLRGVCLERIVDLDNVRLRLRDWPGHGGPLVHVPDPLIASPVIERIAASMAPRYRVVSLSTRASVAYQVHATDLLEVLRQFGFTAPVLVGEGLGCLTALIVAAWYPTHVSALILVEPTYAPPPGDTLEARALRDCPPDVVRLRSAVRCPVLETQGATDIETFVAATLP
jgi:pimeloyl-ACP methyl ester carboxylesterase